MAEPHGCSALEARRKCTAKRATTSLVESEQALSAATPAAPCGACKFLRRKCISGCIFAPHFGSDQGAARFAAVHKVFGASNVSKLLLHIPVHRRQDAVMTISYEAQARLSDPVYGCVSTIVALQQQVASLQAELALVQAQLINSRFVMANALQNPQQGGVLQPAYSNNSSVSNNFINNMSNLTPSFDLVVDTAPSSQSMVEPLQISQPPQDDEDEEEESRIPSVFVDDLFNQR